MGKLRYIDLIHWIRQDLAQCFALFPGLVLVWSEIISRPAWALVAGRVALEKARRGINRAVSVFVSGLGGLMVRHHELERDDAIFLRNNGVHLTAVGLDIFDVLMSGVEAALAAGGRRGSSS